MIRHIEGMPSIFIWKANIPNTSKQFIRCYSGSNWYLEDHDDFSSYIYLQQIVIPGYNDSVITFHVKKMPVDWVGADLLEVNQVPIRVLKSDHYGKLEHIGNWMRFTSQQEMTFTSENLTKEFEKITQWKDEVYTEKTYVLHDNNTLHNRKVTQQYTPSKKTQMTRDVPRVQESHKKQSHYSTQYTPPNPSTLPHSLHYAIDEQTIHQNFKQFLDKFNINNVTIQQRPYSSYSPASISIVSGNRGRY